MRCLRMRCRGVPRWEIRWGDSRGHRLRLLRRRLFRLLSSHKAGRLRCCRGNRRRWFGRRWVGRSIRWVGRRIRWVGRRIRWVRRRSVQSSRYVGSSRSFLLCKGIRRRADRGSSCRRRVVRSHRTGPARKVAGNRCRDLDRKVVRPRTGAGRKVAGNRCRVLDRKVGHPRTGPGRKVGSRRVVRCSRVVGRRRTGVGRSSSTEDRRAVRSRSTGLGRKAVRCRSTGLGRSRSMPLGRRKVVR